MGAVIKSCSGTRNPSLRHCICLSVCLFICLSVCILSIHLLLLLSVVERTSVRVGLWIWNSAMQWAIILYPSNRHGARPAHAAATCSWHDFVTWCPLNLYSSSSSSSFSSPIFLPSLHFLPFILACYFVCDTFDEWENRLVSENNSMLNYMCIVVLPLTATVCRLRRPLTIESWKVMHNKL